MANKKITGLTELTTVASDDYFEVVDTSAAESKKISRENLAGWHFLTTPLTSTSWDGAGHSTTAKTKIDLSTVFGAPAGIKAVLLRVSAADSGSASGNCSIGFAPNNTAFIYSLVCKATGRANDDAEHVQGIVPCDANGDIYFQCTATDVGTLDVIAEIWGYWL